MRRFVEPGAWAVAAAAPLLSPLVGVVAMVALGIAALWRPAARHQVRGGLGAVPPIVLVGAGLLSIVHAARGAAWGEPLAVAVWAVLLLAAGAEGRAHRRPALALGSAAAIVAQAFLVVPALGEGRASGWVGHPNLLAAGAVLAAVVVVLAAPRRGRWAPWGVAALAAVAIVVALATGSRGTWLGATFGVAAWALALPVRGRADRGLRLLALAAIVVAGAAVGAVRGFAPEALLRSDVERAVVQGVAASLAAERPVFGHGGGPWATLAQRVEPSLPADVLVHAHSVPLHVAARGGGFALALALFAVVPAARRGARALVRRARDDRAATLALAVAVGVLVVQSLVDLVLQHPTVYVGVWLVLVAARDRWRDVSSVPVERWDGA